MAHLIKTDKKNISLTLLMQNFQNNFDKKDILIKIADFFFLQKISLRKRA